MQDLETLTLLELQDKLIGLGMPEDDVHAFKTKAPLIASIKMMTAKATIEMIDKDVEEVKKVATIEEKPNPSEDREVNKKWKSKAEAMKAHLMKQPKVSILIPLEPGEKRGVVEWRTDKYGEEVQVHVSGAVESVQLNGFKYFIPKGVYYPVPQQIAEIISEAQSQTLDAGREIAIDRIDPKTGKPIADML